MSGLKNEPYEGGNFLNFKDGKIITTIGGVKQEFTSVEGIISELDVKDANFKGDEYRKIILFIVDDEGTKWNLGFPLESGYGNAFCSIAQNIDFKKPVKISGGIKELEGGNSYGMLFVKQDGKNLKWFYTKDSEEVPKGERKMIGRKEFFDFSQRNDFFHHLLIEKIRPAILGKTIEQERKVDKKGKKYVSEVKEDDLPF